jgi:hypothetical protein
MPAETRRSPPLLLSRSRMNSPRSSFWTVAALATRAVIGVTVGRMMPRRMELSLIEGFRLFSVYHDRTGCIFTQKGIIKVAGT